MGVRGEVFSKKVILQNRTYFFNIKENRMGDLYLNMVESKNRDAGGFDRQSIILFADDLQEFLQGFDESLQKLEELIRKNRREAWNKDKDHSSIKKSDYGRDEPREHKTFVRGAGEPREHKAFVRGTGESRGDKKPGRSTYTGGDRKKPHERGSYTPGDRRKPTGHRAAPSNDRKSPARSQYQNGQPPRGNKRIIVRKSGKYHD